ncbi:maleylpyruvate isomerase N-terminal domain-containing protein, partial [Mycobacterium kansasii]
MLPISDAEAAYRLVHRRVDSLLRGRADVAELTVPACPDWTVHQTVAHLTGIAQDIATGNLDDVGSQAWTQAQVERLDGLSIDELLD